MSVRLVLDELAAARESLDRATAFLLKSSTLTTRVLPEECSPVNKSTPRTAPITVVTENGFSIVRLCECESTRDSASGCHFIVRAPNGDERRITVLFAEAALTLLQEQSASFASLATDDPSWVPCSERHLATYLRETDCHPPGECLIVDTLTPEDLLLAQRTQ